MEKKVNFIILLMEGFSLLSLGGFLDKLRFSSDEEDYGRQINCSWLTTSLEKKHITASCGAKIFPDTSFNELNISRNDIDFFVIFGGGNPYKVLTEASLYYPLIKKILFLRIPIVSVDNAAFLLASAGLNFKKISVHWRHVNEFREFFPSVDPVTESSVINDGGIFSCPGGNATIELAAYLIETHLGRTMAIKGLSDMLVGNFVCPQHYTWHSSELENMSYPEKIAISVMRKNLGRKMSAEEIAYETGVSRRQLDRLILKSSGQTTYQKFMEMKISQVCWLLVKSSRTLSQIAEDTGFHDSSHLSRIFRQFKECSPGEWRRRHPLYHKNI